MNSQISKHLTVNFYTCFCQSAHQRGISHSMYTGSRINPLDPQGPKFALAHTPVTICILTRFINSLLCCFECVLATAIIAFCGFYDFFVTGMCRHATTYSCHNSLSLSFIRRRAEIYARCARLHHAGSLSHVPDVSFSENGDEDCGLGTQLNR